MRAPILSRYRNYPNEKFVRSIDDIQRAQRKGELISPEEKLSLKRYAEQQRKKKKHKK